MREGSIGCIEGKNTYKCVCKKVGAVEYLLKFLMIQLIDNQGYKGVNCEIKTSSCSTIRCHNGGTCVDSNTEIDGFRCACVDVSVSNLLDNLLGWLAGIVSTLHL